MTDLGAVTRTLKTLVEQELLANGLPLVNVTAAPPDADTAGNNVVSIYLFHVKESPELKNAPPSFGSGPVPIQHAPMGLILQYIITVLHTGSGLDPDPDVLTEQRLIGHVARAVHDYPVITENTTITVGGIPVPILDGDLALQKNDIELNLRPASMEESVNFWSAQDERVARLSLFVEARVAILEPKPALDFPGLVLSLGAPVFPGGPPQLTSSRTVMSFQVPPVALPPGATDDIQSVVSKPARGSLFPNDPNDAGLQELLAISPAIIDNNQVTLEGSGLSGGEAVLLLTKNALTVEIALDPPLAQNAEWNFERQSSRLTFSARRTVTGDVDGASTTVNLEPGVCSARLRIVDPRRGNLAVLSNIVSLTLVPQVRALSSMTGDRYQLTIVSDYLQAGADMQLSVRGSTLIEGSASVDGEFEVIDGSTIEFTVAGLTPSQDNPVAVSLLYNGASSTPAWLMGGP